MIADGRACFAQSYDFGVRGGIGIRDVTVPAAAHD
jgi:hypothetical protein